MKNLSVILDNTGTDTYTLKVDNLTQNDLCELRTLLIKYGSSKLEGGSTCELGWLLREQMTQQAAKEVRWDLVLVPKLPTTVV
jgi:hypothetical protein